MFKTIFAISALLFATQSFASGKLVFEPRYMLNQERTAPSLGLSIYEPLNNQKTVYINSWTGFGEMPWVTKEDVRWITAKNTMEIPLFNWHIILGVGGQINYNIVDKSFNNSVHARVVVKLW